MENNVVEEDDEIFFDALDYMTAPERNYLANIQRGTMSKEKLARKFSVTLRTIRSIVNSEEKLNVHEDPNLDLFSE